MTEEMSEREIHDRNPCPPESRCAICWPEEMYLILHRQLVQGFAIWWRPNRCGYTNNLAHAGRYSKEEAESIARIRGDDFPVAESEIGKSLMPRTVICVEDAENFEQLKRITGRPAKPFRAREDDEANNPSEWIAAGVTGHD